MLAGHLLQDEYAGLATSNNTYAEMNNLLSQICGGDSGMEFRIEGGEEELC